MIPVDDILKQLDDAKSEIEKYRALGKVTGFVLVVPPEGEATRLIVSGVDPTTFWNAMIDQLSAKKKAVEGPSMVGVPGYPRR